MSLRRAQPHRAARRVARGGGDRRGDPRHADRQPRRARAPVRRPTRRPAAPSAGRWSWCRATCACAARSRRCASAAAGRRCAKSQVLLADGDRSVMTIEPLRAPRPRAAPSTRRPAAVSARRRAAPRPAAARRAVAIALWLAGGRRRRSSSLRARYVADLSAFLPSAPTPEQAVLLDQLKSGAPSRLLLIGIEGGDAGDARRRARRSGSAAAAARERPHSTSVHNGDTARLAATPAASCSSIATCSARRSMRRASASTGLRDAIDDTVALLGTPAGALIKPILLRDPTGETVRIAEAMTPAQRAAQRGRRLGLAHRAARGAGGDDARRRRRPRRPAAGARRGPQPPSRSAARATERRCGSSCRAPAVFGVDVARADQGARSSGSRSPAARSWSRCCWLAFALAARARDRRCCRWRPACSPASPRSASASARCTA